MRSIWRLGEPHDVKTCVTLLEPYQPLYGAGYAWLEELLHFLLAHSAINFEVWCEGTTGHEKIIGFDICTFISDDFAEQMLKGPPFIAGQILELYRQDRLPILTPRAAIRANAAEGLTILHLFGALDKLQHEQVYVYLDRCMESLYRRLRGLRCRRLFGEAYGELFLKWLTTAGYTIANDYAEYYERHPLQMPPPEIRPRLILATAEDAARDFGSRMAPVFRYVPPRFGFAPSEQALLRLGLQGETDEELAESLQISVSTVKKRWRQIYDRVTKTDSRIIANNESRYKESERSRGGELRRHLLNYLRDHFEELSMLSQWNGRGPQGETLRRSQSHPKPARLS